MKLTVHPLTPERWPDLEALFNTRGCSVARGCWCMFYRRSGARGKLPKGRTQAQANRAELKALVDSGKPPGLLGYHGKVPVGWVSIGPRDDYAKLRRSPVMSRLMICRYGRSSASSFPHSIAAKAWRGRFSMARLPMPGSAAQRYWKRTRSTSQTDPATMPCGSVPSRCMTPSGLKR